MLSDKASSSEGHKTLRPAASSALRLVPEWKPQDRFKRTLCGYESSPNLCLCCCLDRAPSWLSCNRWCCYLFGTGESETTLILCVKSIDAFLDNSSCHAYTMIQDEFIEELVSEAWEHVNVGEMVHLRIQTLNEADVAHGRNRSGEVAVAVFNTFVKEANYSRRELSRTCQEGFTSTLISIGVIALSLVIVVPLDIAQVDTYGNLTPWGAIIIAIFVIVIWVAVWHPVELLIYDRWSKRVRTSVCRALADSRVTIELLDPSALPDRFVLEDPC